MFQVEYAQKAFKELSRLDRHEAALILSWIEKNLVNCENPRQFGKALSANLKACGVIVSETIGFYVKLMIQRSQFLF